MIPLNNEAFWRNVIDSGQWHPFANEDLFKAILKPPVGTKRSILNKVIQELLRRANRIVKKNVYETGEARTHLIDHALGCLYIALREPKGKKAVAFSAGFASTLIFCVRSERRKVRIRKKILESYGTGVNILATEGRSNTAHDLNFVIDFWDLMSKINDPRVLELLEMRAGGDSMDDITRVLGVSETTVRKWLKKTGLRELLEA